MKVSFVIPTLNSERTLKECLGAILNQSVPREQYEIVIADAGSQDSTVSIAKELGVDTVVENELKTGEAGKTAGIKAATGDIIALVDSDNILPDDGWVEQMIAPFEDPDVVASEPLEYTARAEDPALTRYFALLGMNDPICLFTGNYDRQCAITGKWTGLKVEQEDKGGWLKLKLSESALPTIGANGFVFRRVLLDHVNWDPYFFDIDVMHQAIAAGHCHVAKVKCGIGPSLLQQVAGFYQKAETPYSRFSLFCPGEAENLSLGQAAQGWDHFVCSGYGYSCTCFNSEFYRVDSQA